MNTAEKVFGDVDTNMKVELRHFNAIVADVRLHWVELGDSKSNDNTCPIILLHGIHDFYSSWECIAGALATTRRVIVPDLPGHGWSERPDATYQLEWYAMVMAKWLEMLNVELADLVGHSFGGGVAQMLLRECRHRFRRLALLAPGGLGKEVAFELRLASTPWLIEKFGQPFMAKYRWQALWHCRHSLTESQLVELSRVNSQDGSARAFARTVSDVINWRGQTRTFFQYAHELPNLPTIRLFWGDNDRIIPIKHAHFLMEAIGGISLKVFEGCGHYPHHEKPDHVIREFQCFFDDDELKS